MSRAFISYSRVDKVFAGRLISSLYDQSYEVWIDWEDIPLTSRWLEEVEAGIESADTFLFLISPDSVSSAVCLLEVAHAVKLNKRLVPLLVRETLASKVPPELASLNWLTFSTEDSFDSSFSQLMEALDTDLDWVGAHTRLLVRAVQWECNDRDDSYLLRGSDLGEAQSWLATATEGKRPAPAALHFEYLKASQEVQTRELARMQNLYRKALVSQLAAQAAQLHAESHALLDRSMLLAIESMRRMPNAEADRVLRSGLRLRGEQIASWRQDYNPNLLAASDNGQLIASCTVDGILEVRNRRDLATPASVQLTGTPTAMAFIPSSESLCIAIDGVVNIVTGEEILILGSHESHIGSLLISPDATSLVSVGSLGATCWGLHGAVLRWRFSLDVDCWSGAISSDGKLVAIGAEDCVLRLLDANTGLLLQQYSHDQHRPVNTLQRGSSDAGIVAAAFLDDEKLVCSAGLDGSVRWWDVNSGEILHRGQHLRDVLCMSVHSARGLVASGSLDNTVRLWDLEGRELVRLTHQAGVTQVSWSIDGSFLLSACGDGCARLWSVERNDQGLTDQDVTEVCRCIHDDWVETALILPDGSPISVSSQGVAIMWTKGISDWRGCIHEFAIQDAICSEDGDKLLVSSGDITAQILYEKRSDYSWRLLEHNTFVVRSWLTRDGTIVTFDCEEGIQEFDFTTLERLYQQLPPGDVFTAALSPDQSWIATAARDEPGVRVWRRREAKPMYRLPQTGQTRSLDFSHDGSLLAVGCEDGSVRVHRIATEEELWCGRHEGVVWCVAFDVSGRYVASGGKDCRMVLRDALTGAVLHEWMLDGEPASLSFSPNGRWLASYLSYEGPFEVQIWDLQDGKLVKCLAHESHVHMMSWDREGSRLATACQDKRIRLFDVGSASELVRLSFSGLCTSVRFVPDTQELLSTSYDGSLRLTLVNPMLLIERAQNRVPRQLTEAEWRQYLPDEPYRIPRLF